MQIKTRRSLGARVTAEGVAFTLWAPRAAEVELVLEADRRVPMQSVGEGYFEQLVEGPRAGATYRYSLDGGDPLPDPASRYQPEGVHGPSQVVDPSSYTWNDAQWEDADSGGIAQRDLVFYELHVGTFTPQGTFRGVISKLEHLKQTGITAIELMPVADFPGRWNWGYDPGSFYAPSRAYGSPDDLRALVDAAHQAGLAVFLDVIYNHFGPDGAYADAFAPFHTDKHQTPWGPGINLDDHDCRGVREFFIDNAIHWLSEYHFDGLRLDAVHALKDDSTPHFLADLSEAVESLPGRKKYLIAEDARNLRTLLTPRSEGGYELDGVWADDFHHQIRNMLAGDVSGYYADFAETTAMDLAETLRQGWFYRGQPGKRTGKRRGTDPSGLRPEQFVLCIQNHDQIGNRAFGDRLYDDLPLDIFRAASALLLLAPQLPLIFMGQEWATAAPFQFFTDHNEKLGPLVSEGRKSEFEEIAGADNVPDPQDPETYKRSQLPWDEQDQWPHLGIWNLYRDVLKIRRQLSGETEVVAHGERALTLRRGDHCLLVALAPNQTLPLPTRSAQLVLSTEQSEYARRGHPPTISDGQIHFPTSAAALLSGCQQSSP